MPAQFSMTLSGHPISEMLSSLGEAVQETLSQDILYVMNRQKTRILERTASGLDLEGQPFHPYNTTRPYYYYPGAASKNRKAAAARFARKVKVGSRTPIGVKFASYAAFKQALGRSTVDLFGPTAPHMLQGLTVRSNRLGEATLGIYGFEGDKAEAHNEGLGNLPQREFLGFSPSDELAINTDLQERFGIRLRKVFE